METYALFHDIGWQIRHSHLYMFAYEYLQGRMSQYI